MKNDIFNITCPQCAAQGKKSIKSRFCVSTDQVIRKQVQSGEYFTWECPGCKSRHFIKTPFLYNDDENSFMVYFIPDFEGKSYKVPTVIKTLKGYKTSGSILRTAAGFPDFIEKIRILESGLDDRIIEAVKMLYSNMYQQNSGKKVFRILFESLKVGELHFGVYLETEDFEAVLPESVYDEAKKNFLPIFGRMPQDEFTVVDQSWLKNVLTREK